MSNVLLSNPMGALVDKTKGDAKNRVECSKAHLANLGTAVATGAGVFASIALGTSFVHRDGARTCSQTIRDALNNGKGLKGKMSSLYWYTVNKIASKTKNSKVFDKITTSLSKIYDKIAENLNFDGITKGQKAGLIVGVAGALTAGIVGLTKLVHKKGQIDQKYTDKAKLESLENKKYDASKEI